MLNTWMLNFDNNRFLKIFEILYFLKFLYFLNYFYINMRFNNKFFIKFLNIADFLKKKNLILISNQLLEPYSVLNVGLKIKNDQTSQLVVNNITNKSFLNKKKYNFSFIFFSIFFLFNYSYFNNSFSPNFNYKLFHFIDNSNKIFIVNTSKIYSRWQDSYLLLYNVFYYKLNPFIFGTPLFKYEILSLNWHFSNLSFDFWKFHSPLFLFKLTNYNKKSDFFFDKLIEDGVNFFIITDSLFHYKNIHYMKKKNLYTIGFVDINTNPWIVNYPIISFIENFISQSFFLKLLFFINREVLFFKFNFFKQTWVNYFNKSI